MFVCLFVLFVIQELQVGFNSRGGGGVGAQRRLQQGGVQPEPEPLYFQVLTHAYVHTHSGICWCGLRCDKVRFVYNRTVWCCFVFHAG